MFQNHTMSLITDPAMITNDILCNTNFITVVGVTTSHPLLENIAVCNAGILVPPTEILMRWADGDPFIMQNGYTAYLNQDPMVDEIIVSMLALLTKKDIILFIPQEEYAIFGQYLLNHLYYVYGIILNTPNTKFNYLEMKTPFIISKFYLLDLMDPMDYINSYPSNMRLPQWVISKLAMELPMNRQATFTEYENYFNQMNMSKDKQEPIPMVRKV